LTKKLEATAFVIAKETRIPRSTVYTVLESLSEKLLISSTRKNNVLIFTPESSTSLITTLREKEEIARSIIPELNKLAGIALLEPHAKVFMGVEGIKHTLEDVLDTLKHSKSKRLYATAQHDILEFMPRYIPDWLKRREALGVCTQLIIPEKNRASIDVQKHFLSNKQRETRFMPSNFPFDCSFDIYDNKISFHVLSSEPIHAITIDSPVITNSFRQFFLFAWEMLNKEKPQI
jgi:sugar-specific transcriptional regulator TrmB